MKTSRKVISLLLSVVMVMTSFAIALPHISFEAEAAVNTTPVTIETADGARSVTQQRVVGTTLRSDNVTYEYEKTYADWAINFLDGHSKATDIVIPGLLASDDYTVQGMAYYPEKDWIMVSAYHADSNGTGTKKPSVIYALSVDTGKFEALFELYNADGTPNYDHGGGLAFSNNNFYYSGDDTDADEGDTLVDDNAISYASLDQFDITGDYGKITLEGTATVHELGGGANAYVCYDNGILWTGNFYAEDVKKLGITFYDSLYDQPATSSYNSMIYGYELQGASSEEEWNYLCGAIGAGTDCLGNPSHVLCIDNGITQIQYAIVDNGKLYLSRSWGTGNPGFLSNVAGLEEYSTFSMYDIDLSTHGTTTVTFNTNADGSTTRTVNDAYYMSGGTDYSVMPMLEGICIIDDQFFLNFESATYRYRTADLNKTLGECPYPVDVVWQVDQYGIAGIERPSEEVSIRYEEITSKSQLANGEEYLIVYESPEKDAVSQKPILYALDCDGGFNDFYLAKHSSTDTDGYVGAVGHAITEYSIEDGKLYLRNPEIDDVPNVRWKLENANSTDGSFRIKTTDTYFSNYPNFCFDGTKISMADDNCTELSTISLAETGSGGFYLSNNGYYLWCNDGYSDESYTTKIDAYYDASSVSHYADVNEVSGTFHCDALNSSGSNIIGGSVTDFAHGTFRIFKRVIDPYASTAESRVYTNLDAELQANGTYNINLETYAISPTQYQTLEAERPTDFIFVLDGSSSMVNNSDSSGYNRYTGDLSAYSIAGDSNTPGDTAATTNSTGDIYVKIGNEFVQLYVDSSARGDDGAWYSHDYYKRFWIHGDYQGTTYWWVPNNPTDATQGGSWSTTKPAESATMKVNGNSDSARAGGMIYYGEHFRYYSSGATRLAGMQTAFQMLADKIATEVETSGLDHRMAVVEFGCDSTDSNPWRHTGMFTSDGTFNQYTGEGTIADTTYQNAFFSYDASTGFQKAADAVWSMAVASDTTNADTFSNYGLDMAYNIIRNYNNSTDDGYYADGGRSVAVIMLTDGAPGYGGDDYTTAETVSDLAIAKAYNCKDNGAYVYTVRLGSDSMTNFNIPRYLEYVSSNYIYAKSLTNFGDKNVNGIDYSLEMALGDANFLANLADGIFNSVQSNSTQALAKLDISSVVREHLSDAFTIPDNPTIVTYTADGHYDMIGNVRFDEPEETGGFTVQTPDDKTILVSGFDYTKNCIFKGNNSGKKLIVSIQDVLPNESADLQNTSINQTSTTAIYQDSDWYNANKPFKTFPTSYFTIPEYNYVLDFGFMMHDDDVNGTLKSVSDTLSAQGTVESPVYADSAANGMVAIDPDSSNQDLIYSLNPDTPTNHAYVLIQRTEGDNPTMNYDWFRINVAPASNVYYEENDITDVASANADWGSVGTQTFDTQDLTNEKTDVYGWDSHYEEAANSFSNGTATKALTSSSAKRSDTKTFTFTGTGFDLVSACGTNTGMMTVKVKDESGATVKVFIVDTYYRDTTYVNTDGLLCQVPVVAFTNNLYDDNGNIKTGTYTVEVTSVYLTTANALKPTAKTVSTVSGGKLEAASGVPADTEALAAELEALGLGDINGEDIELVWFDDNSVLNGGAGANGYVNAKKARAVVGDTTKTLECYLDGFRIYHPLGEASSNYIASEQSATYINVINNINNGITSGTDITSLAYVETAADGTLSFANYETTGPENEFYLNSGNGALAFNVQLSNTATVQLGLRAVTGTASVTIGSGNTAKTFDVKSATEMYYDVTDLLVIDETTGLATVTIQCTSGVLAVNNIKMTEQGVVASSDMSDLDTYNTAMKAPVEVAEVVNGKVVVPVAEVETPDTEVDTDVDTDVDTETDTGSDTETESSGSFLEQLIAMIMEILSKVFSSLSIGG